MLEKVDYDKHQHSVYARGRALSPEAADTWTQSFVRWAGPHRPLAVLDLGSGIGRFTPALAETFGGPVYGVEPSQRMRQVAEESAGHPMVSYLPGSAEDIPLPGDACDLVLMFLVLHHVRDRGAAATEVARVLRPGGRLLVRSTFADRLPDLVWHRYFPRARAIEQELFPTLDEVVATFAGVGLRYVALEQVRQRFAPSLAGYADRLRLRAISVFEYLTEEEIEDGFARLDAAVAAETVPQAVGADCDLLILSAPPRHEDRQGPTQTGRVS
jgi:ubiquinone/menaquinone biosynthesis C-methylase UbiE